MLAQIENDKIMSHLELMLVSDWTKEYLQAFFTMIKMGDIRIEKEMGVWSKAELRHGLKDKDYMRIRAILNRIQG